MRNNVKAYKVVQGRGGKLFSAFFYDKLEFRVRYIPNKLVLPKKGKNPLFVFNNLQAARDFTEINGWGSQIWECEANNVIKNKLLAGFNKNYSFPEHTSFASSVKLTKLIKKTYRED